MDDSAHIQWDEYRLYGLRLRSNFPFRSALPSPHDGKAHVVFHLTQRPLPPPDPQTAAGQFFTPAGELLLNFYRRGECYRLSYPRVADFSLAGEQIEGHPAPGASLRVMEGFFLSSVLTFWLELRGVRGLHASAAVIDGQAVGFLANSGQGKSSFAATCLAAGFPLLSDDILAVESREAEFWARPAYPRLRLWEQQVGDLRLAAKPLAGRDKQEFWVGSGQWGEFCTQAQPLRRLYVLDRRPAGDPSTAITIQRLPPRDAIIELVRYSFLPRLTDAAGLQAARLPFFTRLAGQTPVCRLSYPSGVARLPGVVAQMAADVRGASPAR